MKPTSNKNRRLYIVAAAGVLLLGLAGILSIDTSAATEDSAALSKAATNTQLEAEETITEAPTETPTPQPTDSPTSTPAPTPTNEPTPVPETKTVYLLDGAQTEVPFDTQYCGSKRSEVFHYIDCDSVHDIKLSNFVIYDSREDAVNKGKRPCKRCEP